MGKYSKFSRQPTNLKPATHPIWRGIGCVMAIILPIFAYLGAIEFVKVGIPKGWPIPRSLLGLVIFPDWVWKVPVLNNILRPIAAYHNFYAIVFFTIVFLILLSGIFSAFYSIMYRIVGPPTLTPVDAPPIKYRKVRKSR